MSSMKRLAVAAALVLASACTGDGQLGERPVDDDDLVADDDDTVVDDDDTAVDDDDLATHPPDTAEIFLVYGYPAVIEAASVDAYLAVEGDAEWVDDRWIYDDGERSFVIRQFQDASGLEEGLTTAGSIVVYAGHANFGLGAVFAPDPDYSLITHVTGIESFWNYGGDYVALNYGLLLTNQSYPNFVLEPEDIVENPTNSVIPYLDLERFPNDAGVGPGEVFTPIGTDSYGYPIHYYDTHDQYYKTIVHGGSLDLPEDMEYAALFIRSCQSGRYHVERFDRGVYFFSDGEAAYETAMVYRFLKGIIEHDSWDEIRNTMNAADPIYDYINFEAME